MTGAGEIKGITRAVAEQRVVDELGRKFGFQVFSQADLAAERKACFETSSFFEDFYTLDGPPHMGTERIHARANRFCLTGFWEITDRMTKVRAIAAEAFATADDKTPRTVTEAELGAAVAWAIAAYEAPIKPAEAPAAKPADTALPVRANPYNPTDPGQWRTYGRPRCWFAGDVGR